MEKSAIFFLIFFWCSIFTAIAVTLSSLLKHQKAEK